MLIPLLLIGLIFLAIYIIYHVQTQTRWPRYVKTGKKIPGPSYSFPFGAIGTLRDSVNDDDLRSQDKFPWGLLNMARQFPNENIVTLVLMRRYGLLLKKVKDAKRITQKLNHRMLTPISLFMFQNNGILFTNNDPLWKAHRNAALKGLMKPKFIRHVCEKVMIKNILLSFKLWEKVNEKHIESDGDGSFEVEMERAMNALTFDIIGESAISQQFGMASMDSSTDELNKLRNAFEGIVDSFSAYAVYPAFWKIWKTKGIRNLEDDMEVVKQFVLKLMTERRKEGVGTKHDFLDHILQAAEETSKNNDSKEDYFKEEDVIRTILDVIAAGHETTGHTVCWTLLHLTRNPTALKALYEEVDAKIPKLNDIDVDKTEGLDYQTFQDLPFTDACIKESLRLTPTVPVVGRLFETADKSLYPEGILGVTTSGQPSFIFSPLVLGRDEEEYYDCDNYIPNRWIENEKLQLPMSFGGGGRVCVGERFARLEAKIILSLIIRRYHVSAAKQEEEEEEEEEGKKELYRNSKFSITMKPTELNIRLKKR